MSDLETFRKETRTWLEENCPESMRQPVASSDEIEWGGRGAQGRSDDKKLWLDRMGEKGWICPTWPTPYGGGGLSREEDKVLQEELRRIHARPALFSFGIVMLGPVLLEFASEEQKQRFLPDIVKGRIAWCQGYSEPGSGSDLASLQTKAEDKGDHYLVNGQKIWTSYADRSDWIFCLVRTDAKAAKHDGISFLLFDMASPGVSVSPIQLISGSSPFCQTFFQDVEVPKDQLVGPKNGGWTIAKRLLQHERSMISGMGASLSGGGGSKRKGPVELAKEYCGTVDGRVADPAIRDQVSQLRMDQIAFNTSLRRSAEEAKAGMGSGAASSMFKLYGTELNKRRYETLVAIRGTQALGWEGEGFEEVELKETREWLRSKGNSIEGGTSEIQLNVIAKRVLGLPD
ncbi:MAG: acyl-CoA dehydrogenase family protein [Myxococcota bacterium]